MGTRLPVTLVSTARPILQAPTMCLQARLVAWLAVPLQRQALEQTPSMVSQSFSKFEAIHRISQYYWRPVSLDRARARYDLLLSQKLIHVSTDLLLRQFNPVWRVFCINHSAVEFFCDCKLWVRCCFLLSTITKIFLTFSFCFHFWLWFFGWVFLLTFICQFEH